MEQLVLMPGGSQQFDRFVVAAHNTFCQTLLYGTMPINNLPPILYMHIQMQTADAVNTHIWECRQRMVVATIANLHNAGFANLPNQEDCLHTSLSSPLQWTAEGVNAFAAWQSKQSLEEQQALLQLVADCFVTYQQATNHFTKNLCIVGGPGVGKSTLLQLLCLHAACQGLTVAMTALMSEQS